MKRDYPDRPIVGVGAVIVENGRVVLVQRAREPLQGEWSIPGGVLELGETLREGTAREAYEETGLVVAPAEVLDIFDRIVPDARGRTQYHYVLIDFLCTRIHGELRAGSDASDARWVTPGELEQLTIAEATAALLKKAFERAR